MATTTWGRRRRILAGLVLLSTAACNWSSRDTDATNHRLRVTNIGDRPINDLQISFPGETVTFGSVPVGATTPYVKVPLGVYAYGSYQFTVDGTTVKQFVIDWVGEKPLEGSDFTYLLEITALPNNQYGVEKQVRRER